MKLSVTAIVLIGIVAVLVLFGVGLYGYAASIQTQAVERETGLVALYKSNEIELSTYVSTFFEQTGLAQTKSEKLGELVKGAMAGRYGDEGFKGGSFAAAIAEAYPDLKSLEIYDKILPTISAGREGFRNKQNQLMDRAREYDTWRKAGLFRRWVLSGLYPSSDLTITVAGTSYSGQQALDKMTQPILTASTTKAFETGTMEPLTVPK